ncbi:MAG: DinB family protein [Saprospiraceae bacterium]|nr:DinB family protein [Saprospiraceae bacterium]
MKDYLLKLVKYNIWANERFIEIIKDLSDEQLHREINSSFNSVFKTLKHLYDAEKAWWMRLHDPSIVYNFNNFEGLTFNKLIEDFRAISKEWQNFIQSQEESVLQKKFKYRRADAEYESYIYDALIHIFNHATYHRGQLTTLLRQLGCEKLPSTDFIQFTRTL